MNARKKLLFQQTYAATACLSAAARAAEISVSEGRKLRDASPPAAAADSLRAAVVALESEAVRRALEGVAVPVFHQGKECGSTVKHSDTLLMFLLKTLSPARYAAAPAAPSGGARLDQPVLLEIDLSAADTAADAAADAGADAGANPAADLWDAEEGAEEDAEDGEESRAEGHGQLEPPQ